MRALCRSHQKLLLDTATSELIFLTDFFLNAGELQALSGLPTFSFAAAAFILYDVGVHDR